jgi:Predicted TIM-barrel enzyme
MEWIERLFGSKKPIIAMCHLHALPGDPQYDPGKGIRWVIGKALQDLTALQDGGVDGVMFSNEYSIPYLTRVEQITVASMARIIGELKNKIKIPFGVNVLWDPMATTKPRCYAQCVDHRVLLQLKQCADFRGQNQPPCLSASCIPRACIPPVQ